MKVKVNVINTWCILMADAITVSNLIVIVSLVSEIWLATDRQTYRQTDTHTHTRTHYLASFMLTLSKHL